MAEIAIDQDTAKRAQQMYELYARGATLAGVGERYGLTRERVRQIFHAAGLSKISAADRRRRIQEERADEIVKKFSELHSSDAVAKGLSLPKVSVEEVLRQRVPASALRKRPEYAKKYTDDELIGMVREASCALGGVLAKTSFEAYARGRVLDDGRPWPTAQTHMLRFGTWRRALEAAGLRSNPSSPIAGQVLFDEAQCIDAVRHVARKLDKAPTVSEYERHARESNGGLPSSATVRHRCGGWLDILRKAGL